MNELITVDDAARLLGCSKMYVRSACERGIIGDIYGNGKERKHYKVFPSKLAEILGVSVQELTSRVKEERNAKVS